MKFPPALISFDMSVLPECYISGLVAPPCQCHLLALSCFCPPPSHWITRVSPPCSLSLLPLPAPSLCSLSLWRWTTPPWRGVGAPDSLPGVHPTTILWRRATSASTPPTASRVSGPHLAEGLFSHDAFCYLEIWLSPPPHRASHCTIHHTFSKDYYWVFPFEMQPVGIGVGVSVAINR